MNDFAMDINSGAYFDGILLQPKPIQNWNI